MKKNIKLYSLYTKAVNKNKNETKKKTVAFITRLKKNVKERANDGCLTFRESSESYSEMVAMRWFRRFSGYRNIKLTETIRLSNNKKRFVDKIILYFNWDLTPKKKHIFHSPWINEENYLPHSRLRHKHLSVVVKVKIQNRRTGETIISKGYVSIADEKRWICLDHCIDSDMIVTHWSYIVQ